MIKKASYVGFFEVIVAVTGVVTLQYRFPIGPIVMGLTFIPLSSCSLQNALSREQFLTWFLAPLIQGF